jgi:hypothetical protein
MRIEGTGSSSGSSHSRGAGLQMPESSLAAKQDMTKTNMVTPRIDHNSKSTANKDAWRR